MYIYLKWYNMNLNYNYKGSQYKKNKTYLSNQIMFFYWIGQKQKLPWYGQ
jgi:hypothetical protein